MNDIILYLIDIIMNYPNGFSFRINYNNYDCFNCLDISINI